MLLGAGKEVTKGTFNIVPAHKVEKDMCKPLAPTLLQRPYPWHMACGPGEHRGHLGRLLKQEFGFKCPPRSVESLQI